MKRALVLLAGMLGVSAAASTPLEPAPRPAPPAQTKATPAPVPPVGRLELLYRVADGDTATHVDMLVGNTTTIGVRAFGVDGRPIALTAAQIRWTTGNTGVAKVTNAGVVTARARGYATLTAVVGTVGRSVRACVTTVERESLPLRMVDMAVAPGLSRIYQGSKLQLSPRMSFKPTGSTQWGECVHWSLAEESRARARVDRNGVVYFLKDAGSVDLFGTIGPRVR